MFRPFRRCFKSLKTMRVDQRTMSQNKTPENDKIIEIFINGKSVEVPSYYTIMQALRREHVAIPSFCYHERLSIAGNCRMCLVQVEGWMKPQIACGVNVMKGMKIRTNSPIAYQAQEGVLEFILSDHPLDCPICDQGGECDLQDLSFYFGNDRSRFTEIHFGGKRAVEHKHLSTLIRSEMTRCIHCTRCIRFASQVCGMDVLGTSGRGHDMLVGTYVDKQFFSELSGNIIDLCPVGALIAIPYMFKARPWEVARTNSIDVTDATGTNIVLNHRFDRLLRVLPRENHEVNQEWLSDKGRWAIDSLEMQRLVTPMIREGTCLCPIEWECALQTAASLIQCCDPCSIMAIAGPHTNAETLVVTKDFLNILGCENTYIQDTLKHTISGADLRASYSLNMKMKNIAKADKIVLVGTNPRFEAPILNAWIRQAYMFNECDIYAIGPWCEYNYYVDYIGKDVEQISEVECALKGAKRPLIFVGLDQLAAPHASYITNELMRVAANWQKDGWNVVHVIPKDASFTGALEAGWKPGAQDVIACDPPKLIISLGADEIFYNWKPSDHIHVQIIYIGFQGDRGAEMASIVLPGSAYTEGGGTFLNMECRSQHALRAITSPGKARLDWKIMRALAEVSGVALCYSDETTLSSRMAQISPNFTNYDTYQPKCFTDLVPFLTDGESVTSGNIKVCLKKMQDYYCTDVFTYNSPSMVKAQKSAQKFTRSDYAAI